MINKSALIATVCCVTLAFGCAADTDVDETGEIVANLVEAGFPRNDITVVEGLVYVGGDAHVTLQASLEMLVTPRGPEQYRSTNVVSGKTKICLNPTPSFNEFTRLSWGLDLAISNYNALPLAFEFARGPNQTGCSANIRVETTTGNGASSGFPSGGNPYPTIRYGTGLQAFSLDVNEHVMTHEIGHTIGLRHTDYYNRSISCGVGGNEGAANVGVVHIPGTPTTATVGGSIMNACFRSTETGEFTSGDITALNALY